MSAIKARLEKAISKLTEEDLNKQYEFVRIQSGIGLNYGGLYKSKEWGLYPHQKDTVTLREFINSRESDSTKLSIINLKPDKMFLYSSWKHPWNDVLMRLVAPASDEKILTLEKQIDELKKAINDCEFILENESEKITYKEGLVKRKEIDKSIALKRKLEDKCKELKKDFDYKILKGMRRIY